MMHVSPCAWYCFHLSSVAGWEVRDLKDRTLLTTLDGDCLIEVVAARRTEKAEEDEVAEIHERYLRDEGILAVKTMVAENSCRVSTYVTRGLGADEREHVVCHAYWKNYCAFIKYHGRRGVESRKRIQIFYDLINSLQPLALD